MYDLDNSQVQLYEVLSKYFLQDQVLFEVLTIPIKTVKV